MTIQDAAKQAVAGEQIDPAYLGDEPPDMASRYAEVFRYFAEQETPFIRLSNYAGPCSVCGGRIAKLIAKVPGAVRFDGCCSVCGEDEFHTAGWTGDDAGTEARNSVRGAVVT